MEWTKCVIDVNSRVQGDVQIETLLSTETANHRISTMILEWQIEIELVSEPFRYHTVAEE